MSGQAWEYRVVGLDEIRAEVIESAKASEEAGERPRDERGQARARSRAPGPWEAAMPEAKVSLFNRLGAEGRKLADAEDGTFYFIRPRR
ncbi:MAG: hypothetical protein ACLFV3_09990 [Phycisphaeraceae bacterium]